MRDPLTLLVALAVGLALAALPFLHYRFGAAHHGGAHDHSRTAATVASEHSHHH